MNNISVNALDGVCMEYYSAPNVAKVLLSAPIGLPTNNFIIVYNETQSTLKQKPVWQVWENLEASALREFTISGQIGIYSGDYNGFLWQLDDRSLYGDGAAINGTSTGGNAANTLNHVIVTGIATSGTLLTLTDNTKTFAINTLAQKSLTITAGTNAGLVRTIVGNTATTVTVNPNFRWRLMQRLNM